LMALVPPPPIPITLIFAGALLSSFNSNIRPPFDSHRVIATRSHDTTLTLSADETLETAMAT
jgi:hypothetical protein